MKKLFALIAVTLFILPGCNKIENEEQNGISYRNLFYSTSEAILTRGRTGDMLILKSGSRLNYTNPQVESAYYAELTIYFQSGEEARLDGEYELSSGQSNMEFAMRYIDNITGETKESSFSDTLISGTITITTTETGGYSIAVSAYTNELLPLQAHHDGLVRIAL